MILLWFPMQQLIMAEKDTMGKYKYVAASLLLRLVQGMWTQSVQDH